MAETNNTAFRVADALTLLRNVEQHGWDKFTQAIAQDTILSAAKLIEFIDQRLSGSTISQPPRDVDKAVVSVIIAIKNGRP